MTERISIKIVHDTHHDKTHVTSSSGFLNLDYGKNNSYLVIVYFILQFNEDASVWMR